MAAQEQVMESWFHHTREDPRSKEAPEMIQHITEGRKVLAGNAWQSVQEHLYQLLDGETQSGTHL